MSSAESHGVKVRTSKTTLTAKSKRLRKRLPAFYEENFGIASRKMKGEIGRENRALEARKSRSLAFATDCRRESRSQLETA